MSNKKSRKIETFDYQYRKVLFEVEDFEFLIRKERTQPPAFISSKSTMETPEHE